MSFLTVDEAKDHLRITDSDHDNDVEAKRAEAEAIVRDFVGVADPENGPADDLSLFKAGAKLVLAHLWENRGEGQTAVDEALWDALWRLFRRVRPPALS